VPKDCRLKAGSLAYVAAGAARAYKHCKAHYGAYGQ